VYAIDISLLTAYKYMYMYVHYRRENTFTSMKTPVRLESHRAQKETFFFLSPSFGFEDFLRPPPLPYFKVNIYPFLLPHFASVFFAYL
jgi:hypothetical protein